MRHSLLASALCITLLQTLAYGRAQWRLQQLNHRTNQPLHKDKQGGVPGWLERIFRRDTCYEDAYFNFVYAMNNSQAFCQGYMNYPAQTTTVDYTSTRFV
jgi:hypothetical protein